MKLQNVVSDANSRGRLYTEEAKKAFGLGVLYEDRRRLLELSIFMSLNPHQLNEGIGDSHVVLKMAKKAGLKLGSGRSLLKTLSRASIHVSKVIYYAIKAKTGDRDARTELKELLKKKVSKEELIDLFFKLDTLTLSVLTGPINIIDAVMGWNIVAALKEKGITPDQRIKDAIGSLSRSIESLPDKLKRKILNNITKIKKLTSI